MTQAGAALSTYGNTFEETIGLITAGTEIFQGRSQQVARGLNTVASRVAKNEKALKKYGVEIYDENKELRSTYDILKDLSEEWEHMSSAQRVALGTTLAGVNQYKVFSAVMTNFNTAVKASGEAFNSQGSALRENEKYMESIQARIQAVKNELQEMILKSDLDKLIKNFLKFSQTVLKVQNYIGGLKPLLVAISGILLTFNLDKIIVNINKIMGLLKTDALEKILFHLVDFDMALKNLANGQKVVIGTTEAETAATEAATVATETYTVALSSLQFVAGLVTIAITALVIGINAYNSAQEKRIEKAHEAIEEESEQVKKLGELEDKIKNEISSREDLINIVSENLKQYKDEIATIDDLNKARARTLELLEQEKKKEAEKLQASAGATYEKESKQLENLEFGKKFGGKTIDRKARSAAEAYKKYVNPEGTSEDFYNYIIEQRNKLIENTEDFSAYATLFGFSSKEDAEEVFNYIENQYQELTDSVNGFKESLRALGYVSENGELLSIEDTLTSGSGSYGKGNAQEIFQEIAQVKEQYQLTDEEALKVKENLKNYGYDVERTVNELQLGTVKKAKEAEDELAAFVEVFGLTEKEQADILEHLAENDYDIGATMEALGIGQDVLDSWEEYSEETERANALLAELGIKENALQKEIGMSSVELIRQADAWNMDANALYYYLKALNQFDESVDNIQSNYQVLQSAIDEYNEMQGFSIDTMQSLLKMSPEYLQMLDDAINGNKNLKDSITNKIKAQANEAKQVIYNTAIERLNALITEDNTETDKRQEKSYKDTTKAIDEETNALNRNSVEQVKNTVIKNGANKLAAEEIMEDMDRQISIIDKAVLTLGTDFSSAMGKGNSSAKDTNSTLKEQNNLLKEQKQLLEEKKKQYDTVVSYIKKKIQDEIKSIEKEKKAQVDAIKEQIDALKDLKKEELDRIQEQIDALKEQKSVEQEFWQSKIDALKEQNDELNTQLEYEELLENLAKAKSKRVRVYKEGQGFVYTEDTNEVDKAQAKVEEFQRKQTYEEQLKILENYKKQSENNYEDQIKALEKLKDEKEKNYEQQIKDLENYQKQIEDQYDARIAYFQSYLDKFTEQTDAYENEQNRQLAIQLTGIDFEQQGWQTRLDNLANFVEKYNALLGDIHTLDTNNAVVKTDGDGGGGGGDDPPVATTPPTPTTTMTASDLKKAQGGGMPTADAAKVQTQERKTAEWYAKNYGGKKASGDSSIKEDGLYLVGDSPNQELVIGSKLNGNLMNLTQGSGVVNASSTRTLAGMLNQLGFMGNQGVNMSNSQNKSTNITIGNISLPSVQNGKDFVDYLQNFSLQMTQEAFV